MVSIIMGVYNGESTLNDSIQSIISQTYEDWELIVCDDSSTDGSIRVLDSYAEKDNRIIVLQNEENKGLAATLNRCLALAHGEYIARMDCDDISAPNRLERQVGFLDQHSEYALVGTLMQEFNDKGMQDIIPHKAEPTKFDIPKGAPFFHATMLIRTSAMNELKGYRISKHTVRTEDVDLWYRFFTAGFIGYNLQEPLYYVRVDDEAYKRRKLKYMLHASYIIWNGCGMLKLPFYYRVFCAKPILSWLFSPTIKKKLRQFLIR